MGNPHMPRASAAGVPEEGRLLSTLSAYTRDCPGALQGRREAHADFRECFRREPSMKVPYFFLDDFLGMGNLVEGMGKV